MKGAILVVALCFFGSLFPNLAMEMTANVAAALGPPIWSLLQLAIAILGIYIIFGAIRPKKKKKKGDH